MSRLDELYIAFGKAAFEYWDDEYQKRYRTTCEALHDYFSNPNRVYEGYTGPTAEDLT